MRHRERRARGFTLIESMIVLVIMAIVAVMASSLWLTSFQQNSVVRVQANFVSDGNSAIALMRQDFRSLSSSYSPTVTTGSSPKLLFTPPSSFVTNGNFPSGVPSGAYFICSTTNNYVGPTAVNHSNLPTGVYRGTQIAFQRILGFTESNGTTSPTVDANTTVYTFLPTTSFSGVEQSLSISVANSPGGGQLWQLVRSTMPASVFATNWMTTNGTGANPQVYTPFVSPSLSNWKSGGVVVCQDVTVCRLIEAFPNAATNPFTPYFELDTRNPTWKLGASFKLVQGTHESKIGGATTLTGSYWEFFVRPFVFSVALQP
ncbi:MAG TPA: type II secretion system protein [Planctomycetota bacterium]|nr:type II secretion system protein [Planctomycetota bacterium]